MTRCYDVEMPVHVRVSVNDESAINAVFSPEWRSAFYEFRDRDEVIAYFARVCAYLGRNDLFNLDGHADQDPKAIQMTVLDVDTDLAVVTERDDA